MVVTPFDWWTENGVVEFDQGNVKIFNVDKQQYLFVDQTMYASTTERDWYIRNVYPKAQGKCLEVGLGLGVASKVMLANTSVSHLLTVEANPFVIAAFGRPLSRHNILNADVNKWLADFPRLDPMYDFIFVDHYTFEEEEIDNLQWVASALHLLLKPEGKMVFWIDENAPDEDQEKIRQLWVK